MNANSSTSTDPRDDERWISFRIGVFEKRRKIIEAYVNEHGWDEVPFPEPRVLYDSIVGMIRDIHDFVIGVRTDAELEAKYSNPILYDYVFYKSRQVADECGGSSSV